MELSKKHSQDNRKSTGIWKLFSFQTKNCKANFICADSWKKSSQKKRPKHFFLQVTSFSYWKRNSLSTTTWNVKMAEKPGCFLRAWIEALVIYWHISALLKSYTVSRASIHVKSKMAQGILFFSTFFVSLCPSLVMA